MKTKAGPAALPVVSGCRLPTFDLCITRLMGLLPELTSCIVCGTSLSCGIEKNGSGRAYYHALADGTIYAWKAKYSGLEVSEARRLRKLEDENHRLKRLVADLSLDREMLKAVIAKNGLSS
jgi:putative transposase